MITNYRDEMKLFLSKLLVLIIVFGMLLSIGVISAAAAIESLSHKVEVAMAQPNHERWLKYLYDQLVALTPEQNEEAHRKLSTVVAILRPYWADLRPLYEAVYVGDNCNDKKEPTPK
jgi:hypothetical protein